MVNNNRKNKKKKSDITAVVSSYNPRPELKTLLERLVKSKQFYEVYLIDSGSTNGSIDNIKNEVTGIKIIRHSKNVGPCVTRNKGIKVAKTPFVLLLDDDITIAPNCVKMLYESIIKDPQTAMVTARILFKENPTKIQYEGGKWHYAGLPHMNTRQGKKEPYDVDIATTSCLLVRKDAILDANGFDENLYHLTDDVELSLRLRYFGYNLLAVPKAQAWNQTGQNQTSIKNEYPAKRVRLHSRNQTLIILGLYNLKTLVLLSPALLTMEFVWFMFSISVKHPLAYLIGKIETPFHIPGVIKRRREIINRKVVQDKDILGAPSLTLTSAALKAPFVKTLSKLLDKTFKWYWEIAKRII